MANGLDSNGSLDDEKNDLHTEMDSLQIRKALGLPHGIERREGPGPRPVDVDLVRAYRRKELEYAESQEVARLIGAFRDWADANLQVMHELAEEEQTTDGTA